MFENIFVNAVTIARDICRKRLSNGNIAVDATAGNGNDTVFLADIVGDSGMVYAFDIQDEALKNTKEKLEQSGFIERVKLIKDGHENMDRYISDKADLIIFNLGYLPGGNHEITTLSETSLTAVKKSLGLLNRNGIILLVIYHGHAQGKEEKEVIESYIKSLNQKEFNVVRMEFINQVNSPPNLIVIEKR